MKQRTSLGAVRSVLTLTALFIWAVPGASLVRAAEIEDDPPTPSAMMVERWDTYERSWRAAGSYTNPFQDVSLTATFAHTSSGTRLTAEGFHDGDHMWRLRFIPTQLGTWHWTTSSNDRGLEGKTGTIECMAPAKPYLHGPL